MIPRGNILLTESDAQVLWHPSVGLTPFQSFHTQIIGLIASRVFKKNDDAALVARGAVDNLSNAQVQLGEWGGGGDNTSSNEQNLSGGWGSKSPKTTSGW
jgi:hypothetical protein